MTLNKKVLSANGNTGSTTTTTTTTTIISTTTTRANYRLALTRCGRLRLFFWELVGGEEDPVVGGVASLQELATVAASQAGRSRCRASAPETGRETTSPASTKQASDANHAATWLMQAAEAQVAAAASIASAAASLAAAAQSLASIAAEAAAEAQPPPPTPRVEQRPSQSKGSIFKGSSGKGSSGSGKGYKPY